MGLELKNVKQECIPVGCVTTRFSCRLEGRVCICPGRGPTQGGVCLGGVCLGGGMVFAGGGTPLVKRIIDRCKNITLSQISFAGSN